MVNLSAGVMGHRSGWTSCDETIEVKRIVRYLVVIR